MSDAYLQQICRSLVDLFPDLILPQVLTGRVRLDSRQVEVGDLFIALQGSQLDGRRFIDSAIKQGAGLVLVESEKNAFSYRDASSTEIPIVELADLRALLGSWLFTAGGINPDAFNLIGITGTNGKTSVSHYIAQLLTQLKQQTAVIGTVGIGALDDLHTATHTTPDIVSLHRTLADLYQQGFTYQAMEVSSHALDQQRTAGAPFRAAVFTNLSRDHLDYHGSMEAYGEAKLRLFTSDNLALSIVNLDDDFSNQILSSQTAQQCFTYSLSNPKADLYCHQVQAVSNGFQIELNGRWGKRILVLPLLGDFNIANILAALLTLLGLGFDFERLLKIAESICSVPGRMQLVSSIDTPLVIVDYAHTPDALENALQAIQQHIKGKLWCVFGCGGDRDIGKRPLMAEVAERLSDNVVITSDNPRSEVPELIIEQVCQGLSNKQARVEVDRQQAILQTVLQAGAEDVVLVAGKGHETYQEISGVRYSFDDVEQARLAQDAYIHQLGVRDD